MKSSTNRVVKAKLPRPTRSGGFSNPRLDHIMDHPVVTRERHFTPDVALPTRGERAIAPTPDEGIAVIRAQ